MKMDKKNYCALALLATALTTTSILNAQTTAHSWGANDFGQLGDGTTIPRATPMPVLPGAVAVANGGHHGLALKADGTVWAWGDNAFGQLGNGTTNSSLSPIQVPDLGGIVAIAAGDSHSLALGSNSVIFAWGNNSWGQLGDGTTTRRLLPTLVRDVVVRTVSPGGVVVSVNGVTSFGGVAAIAAGAYHSLALKGDLPGGGGLGGYQVLSWGDNRYGQLGDGTMTGKLVPTSVVSDNGIASHGISNIAAGAHHSLALKKNGGVVAYGYNRYGQLGDGTTITRLVPTRVASIGGATGVASLGGAVHVAAGAHHSLAVVTGNNRNFTVAAWGYNRYGQLGDGTTIQKAFPVRIAVSSVSGVPSFGGIPTPVAVAGGGYHSLAVHEGVISAWGYNGYGQLGDGSTINRSVPIRVANLSRVVSNTGINGTASRNGVIAGGLSHSSAVQRN